MFQKFKIPTLTAQGQIRRAAIEKLSYFMRNPGWFSILLLGARGTGKSHWIRQIHEYYGKIPGLEEYGKAAVIKRADQISEYRADLKALFQEAHRGILVIEDIEDLPEYPQQRTFLEALATTDGKVGLDDQKDYVRVIFTSSMPATDLKIGEGHLLHELWDRISQLVVALPSFVEENASIYQDFKATWGKMEFEQYGDLPDLRELREWLTVQGRYFHGNFRDLDKVCILWHQYRLIVYRDDSRIQTPNEVEVFKLMKLDFEQFSKFPLQQSDDSMNFQFEKGHTKRGIEDRFRSKFKAWALKTYGTMQKAAKELDMSPRTMDRW